MPTPSLEELIQTVEDRCPGVTGFERLKVAVEVSGELGELADALVSHFVDTARHSGCTWSQIGDALGMSKQGAQQRFRHLMPTAPTISLERWFGPWRGGFLKRFTGRARAVVAASAVIAKDLGHAYIGTEHLLLAILRDEGGVGVKALARLGIPTVDLQEKVTELAGPPSTEPARRRPPFTPRAKRALELALREALRMGHNYIGTEHLILALAAEGDGLAGRALAESGVDLDALRDAVIGELAA